ncbi:MAG: site-2 protease family protein [Actinomycetota bacterium]|nr:site-2 protease family protein [Actinomycetota bacterium]
MFGTGSSIQLARVFGIRIGASPSWFVVLFVFIYLLSDSFQQVLDGSSTQAYVVAVVAVMLFFSSIVLHELGHAVVAQRAGIAIRGIDLWFFGGVAHMTSDPDTPGKEFRIAVAGPLATLALVGVCVALVAAISEDPALEVILFSSDVEISPALALLGWLAFINTAVLLFNMLPAFPLDGGRIARALIWKLTGNRTRATRLAGRVGEGFAYLLIGVGVLLAARVDVVVGVWLAVVGWFLAQAARGAIVRTALTERIDGITVADIMDAEPVAMPASLALSRAEDEFFQRYGWNWFPAVDEHGRFLGIVRRERVEEEIAAGRPALEIAEVAEIGDAAGWRVPSDRPLETLLEDESLRDRRALMVVDGEGVLRGVVTIEQVGRAITATLA